MSSTICFNLDQSKILSSGNGLIMFNSIGNLIEKALAEIYRIKNIEDYNKYSD